jgi:hemoglobin-like flavoprotein
MKGKAVAATAELCDDSWSISSRDLTLVRTSFESAQPVLHVAPELFYERLFYLAPSLRHLFPEDLREARRRFVPMLGSIIGALEHPSVLLTLLYHLGRRLAGRGVTGVHYEIVGETLIWTLMRVLSRSFTPEIEAAWRAIYRQLVAQLQKSTGERLVPRHAA